MRELIGGLGIGHVGIPPRGRPAHTRLSRSVCERSTPRNRTGTQRQSDERHELRDWLFTQAKRHLNTHSDSELLLNVFAYELAEQGFDTSHPCIFNAVRGVHRRCKGVFGGGNNPRVRTWWRFGIASGFALSCLGIERPSTGVA